ncbi:MAG TPA: hypothetical protein VGC41_11165 [Kofleriaceae bacterium]
MSRATRVLAVTTVLGFATSAYLFVENRSLHEKVVEVHTTETKVVAADPWQASAARTKPGPATRGPAPTLGSDKEESRLDRRQRRQLEIAAMFGRVEGETDDEYRARIVPLVKAGLAIPRSRVEDMRKQAEAAAHVSPEQSKQLDAAFGKTYDSVLDYTNKAVSYGVLSPYERNVSGWLEFGGGLGTMLTETNGQIGQILSADQVKAMSDSGFEWGEYLGLEAPWEKLNPPPPPKH